MKYLNLLCNTYELHCLFPDAKLLESNYINDGFNTLKIESKNNKIDINHYFDINIFQKIQNSKNIFEIDSLYINPTENLTIICDRQLWYRLYLPLLRYQKDEFDKLEKKYVEKNVEVFFNFAILEAVNYEDEEDYFLYDFKFKHIKISDYELFKGKNNFYYDSFYSLYHLLAEGQMNVILYPNTKYGNFEYHIDFKKIFNNFNINNRLYRNQIYSHTCLKPRYHRIKFLLEADKNNILKYGENNVNIQFIEEYKNATENGFIHTDNTKKHTKNHINYFNKEFYQKFLNIIDKINVTADDPDFLYDHLRNYFKYEEYNNSYIDVTGETHCIFDLKYGFFTEKSIKPILAEKFVMVYGSKKVYSEYKRIGIDLFLDEFGLNGIEDKDELEQIDMIINCLKTLDKEKIKKLYIKKYDTIKRNKEKLFEYYCNIMNNINVLLLRKKENKLL
jgi:hypothetical protein